MSKITPKNLSYDSTLPPFLQRLQAGNSGRDGRHQFALARPKRARNEDEEKEDEPVYFNEESGETLTKSEWEARERSAAEEAEEEAAVGDKDEGKLDMEAKEGRDSKGSGAKEKEKENIAAIGAAKKRKAGKVIGRDEGGHDEDSREREEPAAGKVAQKVNKPKGGKKGKKIKLSFGDEE